jgi:hypothetical protein
MILFFLFDLSVDDCKANNQVASNRKGETKFEIQANHRITWRDLKLTF